MPLIAFHSEANMTFNLRAVAVFLAFLGVFALLLESGRTADSFVRAALWTVITAMSVVAIVLTILRGGAYGQTAVVPKRLRQWLLDERNARNASRR